MYSTEKLKKIEKEVPIKFFFLVSIDRISIKFRDYQV